MRIARTTAAIAWVSAMTLSAGAWPMDRTPLPSPYDTSGPRDGTGRRATVTGPEMAPKYDPGPLCVRCGYEPVPTDIDLGRGPVQALPFPEGTRPVRPAPPPVIPPRSTPEGQTYPEPEPERRR